MYHGYMNFTLPHTCIQLHMTPYSLSKFLVLLCSAPHSFPTTPMRTSIDPTGTEGIYEAILVIYTVHA